MAINEKLLIPDTTIEPSFNTVLYTGTSATNAITGVGFSPDLVWLKQRNSAQNHGLFDTVRGANNFIMSNSTSAKNTRTTDTLSSFDADGFTLTPYSSDAFINYTGRTMVAWCFNAGGVEETNDSGTIDSTVKANNDLGFSIVKYTGNVTAGATVGHGLSSAPEMIIVKGIDNALNWIVYHTGIGASNYIQLNTFDVIYAQSSYNMFNSTAPSSTLFTLGNIANTNGSGLNYIAYCFTSKTGVSKVGTYTGTGTSGNVITTGFEPAFVIIKNTDDTGNWMIYDNVRDTDGVLNKIIYANLSNAEATASTATITPTIDGFTIGNSNSKHLNRLNNDFIYYAIADI